jgi:alpha-glucosidase
MGSRAQELALFVVYESALACVADDPEHYRGQPGLKFLRDVPTVWEETRALDGVVGRHVVIARRHGKEWFLGGMAGEDAYRLALPLQFLVTGSYRAEIYADPTDGSAPYDKVIESSKRVRAGDTLEIAMRRAGGVAVRFVPE